MSSCVSPKNLRMAPSIWLAIASASARVAGGDDLMLRLPTDSSSPSPGRMCSRILPAAIIGYSRVGVRSLLLEHWEGCCCEIVMFAARFAAPASCLRCPAPGRWPGNHHSGANDLPRPIPARTAASYDDFAIHNNRRVPPLGARHTSPRNMPMLRLAVMAKLKYHPALSLWPRGAAPLPAAQPCAGSTGRPRNRGRQEVGRDARAAPAAGAGGPGPGL